MTGSSNDSAQHRDLHAGILRGGLPLDLRELLKSAGYELIAGHSVGMFGPDKSTGKRAVVFGWWARARAGGLPDSEANEYFAAHFELLDAKESGDEKRLEAAQEQIRRWEGYAG
jgi:hypothetical protein